MNRGKTFDAWKWLYGLLSLSGKVLNPEWFDLTTLSWPINRRTYFVHTNCHKIVIVPVPITWAHNGSFFFFINSLCYVFDCSCFIRGCTSWPHPERSELYIYHIFYPVYEFIELCQFEWEGPESWNGLNELF